MRREHPAHGIDGLRGLEALVAERLPGAEVDNRANDRAICGRDPERLDGRVDESGEPVLDRLVGLGDAR